MSTFRKPVAGEPANLILGESFQSALVDVVNAYQRGELTRNETEFRKDHAVMVKNTSAADIKSGEMLAIQQDVTPPTYADTVQSFVQNPFVIGDAVTWHNNIGYVAVATQPILQNMVGPCAFRPWGQVQADIDGAGDWLMVSPTDPKQFKRSTGGIARVIAYDATTGKCVADFLEQQPLWRYQLTSDVANFIGIGNLIDLGGNVYASNTEIRFTENGNKAGDEGKCLHTGNNFDAVTLKDTKNAWIQFRLLSGWDETGSGSGPINGTGISTASIIGTSDNVLYPIGGQVLVRDTKKLFQNAVGSNQQTDPNGGSMGWAILESSRNVFEVTECTQKINRYEATINSGTCSGKWGELVPVTIVKPLSVWPYVDPDPSISATGTIDAVNLHGLPANGTRNGSENAAKVWIAFVQDPSVVPDPNNLNTPYSEDVPATDGYWVITDVEVPIATYVECTFFNNGLGVNEWQYGPNELVYDGFKPDPAFTVTVDSPDNLNELGDGSCLANGTKGLAVLDRINSGGANLQYLVHSTSSALNGEAHEAALVGTLSPTNSDPPVSEMLVTVDGCDVKYKRLGKTWIFGDPIAEGDCELDETEVTIPFENWEEFETITNVTLNATTGQLVLEKFTIKSCIKEPADDGYVSPTQMDVVNDVYCSGDSLAKDYRTIHFFGKGGPVNTGVAIDTSCIEIDYTQIIYPDFPYIDYYDILWPDGCYPCDVPEGCCTVTPVSGSTYEHTGTSQVWCDQQAERDDVSSTTWTPGSCPTGCCNIFFTDGTDTKENGYTSNACDDLEGNSFLGRTVDFTIWQNGACPMTNVGCCTGGTYDGLVTSQSDCLSNGGTNWASGQTCGQTPVGCCTAYNSQSQPIDRIDNVTESACDTWAATVPHVDLNNTTWVQSGYCPTLATGCCNNGAYPSQITTEGKCVGGGGTWDGPGTTCNPGQSGCDGTVITDFEVVGLSNGTCLADFVQNGSAVIVGGSTTINGTWTINDGVLPTLHSGTITLNVSGPSTALVWSWTGTMPQSNAGVYNTDTPSAANCIGVTNGTAAGTSGSGICPAPWSNGAYSFTAT